MTDEKTTLLQRLDEALLDGPGGEAEAPLIYAAVEIERLAPNDPVPSCLRALADVLARDRDHRPPTPIDASIDNSTAYRPHRQSWLEGWYCARVAPGSDDVALAEEAREGWRLAFGDASGPCAVAGGSTPTEKEE